MAERARKTAHGIMPKEKRLFEGCRGRKIMTETIKWDGTSPIDHEPIIKTALLSYINAEEKEKAATISYGDLGNILKKSHGRSYHGGSYGECIIQSDTKGVIVDITDLNIKYEMAWNKAAKAIHRWVHKNVQPRLWLNSGEVDGSNKENC